MILADLPTLNPQAAGSSPAGRARKINGLQVLPCKPFLFLLPYFYPGCRILPRQSNRHFQSLHGYKIDFLWDSTAHSKPVLRCCNKGLHQGSPTVPIARQLHANRPRYVMVRIETSPEIHALETDHASRSLTFEHTIRSKSKSHVEWREGNGPMTARQPTS